MKRIGLIPVGGTICTALQAAGDLAVNQAAPLWLTDHYRNGDSPYAGKVEFVIGENQMLLSENMTVEHWNQMEKAYRCFPKESCHGLIVAHGTDTLAFSAALFSQLWHDCPLPVIFVAANRPLSSPLSNGHRNFRTAVECICLGLTPGVYVCYENPSDQRTYLHLASRLEQCRSDSEDFFSREMTPLPADLPKRKQAIQRWNRRFPQRKAETLLPRGELSPCVLLLTPYVGLDYSRVCLASCRAVLHLAYHSGTVCVGEGGKHSVLTLLERCAAQDPPVDCYLFPSRKEGTVYESVSTLKRQAPIAHFWHGTTAECAYAKLLIAYSLLAPERRQAFLQEDRSHESFS